SWGPLLFGAATPRSHDRWLTSTSTAALKARRSRGSSIRAMCFLRTVARLGSSSAVIILQTSLLVRRKKLGAQGRHCSPSASISSAMGRLMLRIPGDGETQEKQQPFPNPAGARILRTELLHLISCNLGDRLYFAAPRRNGGASFMHGAGLDPKAAAFQHGANR